MASQHPYEDLLEKLGEFMRYALDCAKRPINEENIPHDIEARLKKVEEDLNRLEMMSDAMLEDMGVDKEMLKNFNFRDKPNLSEREVVFFTRLEKLQKQAENASTGDLYEPETIRKTEGGLMAELQSKDSDLNKSARKKFKRHGMNDRWKPM